MLDFEYRLELELDGGVVETLSEVGTTHLVGYASGTDALRRFETEMRSLDLGGVLASGGTLLMRESTIERSVASTSVERRGEGLFWTESDWDLWTDLSFDGGVTWTTSGPSVPEPTAGLLAALAVVPCARIEVAGRCAARG